MSELIMTEEGSTPATPSGGNWKVYFKFDGLYVINDAGNEIGPMVPASGWIPVQEAWTRASNTTVNVPSNATLKYQKGWGVRYKQGGGYKYGYIVAVASTLLTINAGSDFTIDVGTITDIAVAPNPNNALGFPNLFNWNPNPQGYSTIPPNATYGFKVFGGYVWIYMNEPSNGVSNMITKQYTGPIAMPFTQYLGSPLPIDNGSVSASGYGRFNSGGTTIDFFKSGAAGWTASGNCRAATSVQGFLKY